MFPFEFIVNGPPVSQQANDRKQLQAWKARIYSEASQRWPTNQPPSTVRLQITVVYYHDGATVRLDNDNMIKPIQDALNGLVYMDDMQITDTQIRKTDLNGVFRIRGMSRVLAEGFCQGAEFLYIRIQEAPDHRELL